MIVNEDMRRLAPIPDAGSLHLSLENKASKCLCEELNKWDLKNAKMITRYENLIEQSINICADLNTKNYKYCSSESPKETIILHDVNQYYL